MRIAVVHSFYTAAQPSGENTVVLQQVEALRNAGHDVHLIARHTDDQSATRGYAHRAALTVASGAGPSPEQELADFDPDVIHLHNTFPNFGTRWLGRWGHKTVVTLHNYRTVCAAGTLFRDGHSCEDCLRTPVIPGIAHSCYRGSRAASAPVAWATRPHGALRRIGEDCGEVIVLNEDARRVLEPALGRSVNVLPNFTPAPSPEVDRNPQGWACIGRLSPEKGIHELVQQWPTDEHLDVFGDGPLRPQVEHAVASRQAHAINLHGLTPHDELLQALPRYEGLILPSMCAEQLPTAVLESLAHGVPIVASDLVTAAAALEGAGAGVTVAMPPTTEGLTRALSTIRADHRFRAAARELHQQRYSPEAWLGGVAGIYRTLLEG